jgi:hypothetical protein
VFGRRNRSWHDETHGLRLRSQNGVDEFTVPGVDITDCGRRPDVITD